MFSQFAIESFHYQFRVTETTSCLEITRVILVLFWNMLLKPITLQLSMTKQLTISSKTTIQVKVQETWVQAKQTSFWLPPPSSSGVGTNGIHMYQEWSLQCQQPLVTFVEKIIKNSQHIRPIHRTLSNYNSGDRSHLGTIRRVSPMDITNIIVGSDP